MRSDGKRTASDFIRMISLFLFGLWALTIAKERINPDLKTEDFFIALIVIVFLVDLIFLAIQLFLKRRNNVRN